MLRAGCAYSLLLYIFSITFHLTVVSADPQTSPSPSDNGGVFLLQDAYIGEGFFDGFAWITENDPTHGRVNYVDTQTAKAKNLSYASVDKFFMRADDLNVVDPNARGRDSVRIRSNKAYADSIIVLDLEHMPQGCGTWPAFWTLSQRGPWPTGGEIDIIEGVNNQTQNLSSLHTTPNCTMASSRTMTGRTVSTNCDASLNNNQGCGVTFMKPNSYGAPFNAVGGGWYVLQRTGCGGASIWFWSRQDETVPLDVKYAANAVEPSDSWGPPDAYFPPTTCDFNAHFDAAQLIFDLTFCGDWAGSVFGQMGCPGSCPDFVDNNPAAFQEAYWEINGLRVYTPMPTSDPSFVPVNAPQ